MDDLQLETRAQRRAQLLALTTPLPTVSLPKIERLAPRHPLRILVAEDHRINLRVTLRILDRLGYDPAVAHDGFEVLEALERQPYDVILMDVQMPGMDGIEAAREIRRRYPAGRRPRLVAVTAHAIDVYHEECVSVGLVDYVRKPIQIEKLIAVLLRCRPLEAESGCQGSPFDCEALADRYGSDAEEALSIVVPHFLRDVPALLVQLRCALTREDTHRISWAANALRGSGMTIGATEFARRCRELEQHAIRGRHDQLPVAVERVERAFDQIRGYWLDDLAA